MRQMNKLVTKSVTLLYIAFVSLYFMSHPTGALFSAEKTYTGNITVVEIEEEETEEREEEEEKEEAEGESEVGDPSAEQASSPDDRPEEIEKDTKEEVAENEEESEGDEK